MSVAIPDFSAVNVLVVGDLMLDQYWFGPTSRISPEAPVPVVKVQRSEARAGGAANVAMNLVSLGTRTVCCGLVGRDASGEELEVLLNTSGSSAALVHSAENPTITKLRVLSRNQQLIRLDTEDAYDLADAAAVTERARTELANAGVCILSDYAKGTLGEVSDIIAACRAAQVPVLVDPKGTDFARYRGASVLTPNLAEFEAVAGVPSDDADLVRRARDLRTELELDALAVGLEVVVHHKSPSSPTLPTASAPARAAISAGWGSLAPLARDATNAAAKQSPAPVGSTSSAGAAG